MLHESSETRAVNGVLENLDACGLDDVLLKRDFGSAIRIRVDPARVGRGERTIAEKSSKNLHQSNSTSENAVKEIETPVTNSDCVLPEWFGCKVASENIAPSCQSERRKEDHNVRVRLRTRKSRAELLLRSETENPMHVRGEMGKLDPSKATETSLDRTDGTANGCLRGARRENNGTQTRSQTSQVCPGIQESRRESP